MSFTDKELKWLQDTADAKVLEIGGDSYTTKQAVRIGPPKRPVQDSLEPATLTGIVEYISAHELDREGLVVHVPAYNQVALTSVPFGDHFQRHVLAEASYAWPTGLVFDQFLDVATFNIRLLSLFQETDDL